MSEKQLDLSMIVAMTSDRAIGFGGGIPWRIPSDMKFFKKYTTGIGTLIQGRKTHQTTLRRGAPLPDRKHIVLSRFPGTGENHKLGSPVFWVNTPEDALTIARKLGDMACIIGGAEIYKEFLPLTDRLYITRVDAEVEGDTFFPEYNKSDWRCIGSSCSRRWHERDQYEVAFEVYERALPKHKVKALAPP